MSSVQTTTIKAPTRVTDRPPILEAVRALGLADRTIAGLMDISAVAVNRWAMGKDPIPQVRYLALLFLVTRLVGIVGEKFPPQSRYARRAAVARDAASAWAKLARDELDEDVRGVYQAETIERSVAMGEQMVAKLELQ
jgi:hypothetical protein